MKTFVISVSRKVLKPITTTSIQWKKGGITMFLIDEFVKPEP